MVPRDKEDTHGEIMSAKTSKKFDKNSSNKLVNVGKDYIALTLGSRETISWSYTLHNPSF